MLFLWWKIGGQDNLDTGKVEQKPTGGSQGHYEPDPYSHTQCAHCDDGKQDDSFQLRHEAVEEEYGQLYQETGDGETKPAKEHCLFTITG